jgi:hypothetical protein
VHFVVTLSLGGVQTGADLKAGIISALASIAARPFGSAAESAVESSLMPEGALGELVDAVRDSVPVALLIDGEGGRALLGPLR